MFRNALAAIETGKMRRSGVMVAGGLSALAAGLAAALALSGNGAAATTTTTFAPTEDSYVSAANPTYNYGTSYSLRVDGSPIRQAYLKFVVSGLSGTVTNATLTVYANSTQSTGYAAHGTSNSWTESGITYENAPALGTAVDSSGPVTAGTWTQVNVTSLVQGDGTVSIGLDTSNATQLSLSSAQGAHAPQLSVTTSGSTTSTTSTTGTTSTTTTTTTTTSTTTTTTTPPPPGPCGSKAGQPSTISKVMWILMENKDYSSIYDNAAAPYETQIANDCGLATNYHAISHPSLPNYVALTSGSTQGITDDSGPSSHPVDADSIYHQAYPSAKGYAEAMTSTCQLSDGSDDAVRHDPWAYYIDGTAGNQRTECQADDVPMGTATSGNLHNDVQAGTLPSFSFVTPDLCNDMHDCSVATGDAYLANLVPTILAGPDYRSGKLAVVIVFDEDGGASGNQVYAAVISPFTAAGTTSNTNFTHYSLLRTTEEILGKPLLGNAASATSMRSAFGW